MPSSKGFDPCDRKKADLPCRERIFGFRIHTGTDCGGKMDDPFSDAMSHYNPGCAGSHTTQAICLHCLAMAGLPFLYV